MCVNAIMETCLASRRPGHSLCAMNLSHRFKPLGVGRSERTQEHQCSLHPPLINFHKPDAPLQSWHARCVYCACRFRLHLRAALPQASHSNWGPQRNAMNVTGCGNDACLVSDLHLSPVYRRCACTEGSGSGQSTI